jgi:hypothetical protein
MSEVTWREGFHPHDPLAIVRLTAPEDSRNTFVLLSSNGCRVRTGASAPVLFS